MRKMCLVLACVACLSNGAWALSGFLDDAVTYYPEISGTKLDDCTLCHTSPPTRNAYGRALANAGVDFSAVALDDSDGDGVANEDEILAGTFPGDATDTPAGLGTGEGEGEVVVEGESSSEGEINVFDLVGCPVAAAGMMSGPGSSSGPRGGDYLIMASIAFVLVAMALQGKKRVPALQV